MTSHIEIGFKGISYLICSKHFYSKAKSKLNLTHCHFSFYYLDMRESRLKYKDHNKFLAVKNPGARFHIQDQSSEKKKADKFSGGPTVDIIDLFVSK